MLYMTETAMLRITYSAADVQRFQESPYFSRGRTSTCSLMRSDHSQLTAPVRGEGHRRGERRGCPRASVGVEASRGGAQGLAVESV